MFALVAAERIEFYGLLQKADRVNRLDWPLRFVRMAWLHGEPLILAAHGPGPALASRAAEIVKEHEELTGLVSIGFCGALHPALQPCDIFVATEIVGVAQPSWPHLDSSQRYRSGKLLSLDRVVSTASEKAALFQTGADAVEMEAAGVASRAKDWNVPFYCIRVVTDSAAESFPLDFNRVRDAAGRFGPMKILGAVLRRPAVLPALMNLNKRCKLAAQALGEFIADARF